jgi:hypothetical protein
VVDLLSDGSWSSSMPRLGVIVIGISFPLCDVSPGLQLDLRYFL